MIKILVADDHTLVRQALAQMLATEPDLAVVGQAASAQDSIEQCRRHAPDVVLMDIHMPRGAEGIEATRTITTRNPRIRVIMLTMAREDHYLFEAIKAGASGYLLKNANAGELLDSIRAVAAGEASLDPPMARRIIEEFKQLAHRESRAARYEPLTERERDILILVGQGATNREIAARLNLSEKTVRNRLSVVFEKLHLNNRTQAALFAVREGFAPEPPGS